MDIQKELEDLRRFVCKYGLFSPDQKLLLAISGGVDSVVMGRLMVELGQPFDVAHCNFGLRGAASDGDEAFVKDLAAEWKATCFATSFDTASYAADKGLSIQMAARELRYGFFEEVKVKNHHIRIATAHHVNDALETMLLNLSHGTGFRGLAAITPARGHFVRPMLAFTGEEIRQIAQKLGITWREDASNAKDDYERNKLRHKVVPVLEELNPSLAGTLKDTLARLWAADSVLAGELRKWEETHLSEKDGYFELALGKEQTSYFVYESLKQRTGMNYKTFEQLEAAIVAGQSGKLFLTDNHSINLDRGRLIMSKRQEGVQLESVWVQEGDATVAFPLGRLQCSHGEAPVAIERSANVALLDAGKLEFPLELRPWREGDSFVPLGMKGQKKISDFMIDAKIPVNLKGRVYVLLSAGRVVWVVGKRIDDRFKITDATRKAYRIELC